MSQEVFLKKLFSYGTLRLNVTVCMAWTVIHLPSSCETIFASDVFHLNIMPDACDNKVTVELALS